MRAIYLASVCLHVLAAMTWIGGMVLFVTAVMPYFRRRSDLERTAFLDWFGARFAAVSWVCFATLLFTGSFNLWMRGVRPADLLRADWRHTPFGSVATVKLFLVVLAVALSAAHERITARAYARWMGRALLVIGIGIVAAAVMMVRAI